MDTNSGRFVEKASAEKWMQLIDIGEVIKIKGAECRVVAIEDRTITLELMSVTDRMFKESSAMRSLLNERTSLLNRHDRRAQESKDRRNK